MPDLSSIPIPSVEAMIERLETKYGEGLPGYTSASRFPASIIFFDSKDAYRRFLDRVKYPARTLSSQIPRGEKGAGFVLRRFITRTLDESRERPLLLVPLTEYIRLYGSDQASTASLFTSLVQSEGAQLVVPMLDYENAYRHFLGWFVHRQRMAEVFTVTDTDTDDSAVLRLHLDLNGRLASSDHNVIDDEHSWFSLWETGEIAEKAEILVRDRDLCVLLAGAEIAVPRVEKVVYRDEIDLLHRQYGIDPAVIAVPPPNPAIWEEIFTRLQNTSKRRWDDLVQQAFGAATSLEALISRYWSARGAEREGFARWLWLNEARRRGVSNRYLRRVVEGTSDPDRLLDHAFLMALSDDTLGFDSLAERRNLFRQLSSPLFTTGVHDLENSFRQWAEGEYRTLDQVIDHTLGIFPIERKNLVDAVISVLQSDGAITADQWRGIAEIWPAFGAYIERIVVRSGRKPGRIVDDWEDFVLAYLGEYARAKLVFDRPTEELLAYQQTYHDEWSDLIGATAVGKVPTHRSMLDLSRFENADIILMDAVGYEWQPVLVSLFADRGWQIDSSIPLFAALPSVTASCPPLDARETFKRFDELVHRRYRHPDTLIEELEILVGFVSKTVEAYKSWSRPIWLVSDHGATAFARTGTTTNLPGVEPRHGGRYCKDPNGQVREKELVYSIGDGRDAVGVSLTYDNLSPHPPQGEAHGGGTPEEVMAMALRLIPPTIAGTAHILTLEPAVIECSSLDESIAVRITGGRVLYARKIGVRMNLGVRFLLDLEWDEDDRIVLPVHVLRDHGLKVGTNRIDLYPDETHVASGTIDLSSATRSTGFEDIFGL